MTAADRIREERSTSASTSIREDAPSTATTPLLRTSATPPPRSLSRLRSTTTPTMPISQQDTAPPPPSLGAAAGLARLRSMRGDDGATGTSGTSMNAALQVANGGASGPSTPNSAQRGWLKRLRGSMATFDMEAFLGGNVVENARTRLVRTSTNLYSSTNQEITTTSSTVSGQAMVGGDTSGGVATIGGGVSVGGVGGPIIGGMLVGSRTQSQTGSQRLSFRGVGGRTSVTTGSITTDRPLDPSSPILAHKPSPASPSIAMSDTQQRADSMGRDASPPTQPEPSRRVVFTDRVLTQDTSPHPHQHTPPTAVYGGSTTPVSSAGHAGHAGLVSVGDDSTGTLHGIVQEQGILSQGATLGVDAGGKSHKHRQTSFLLSLLDGTALSAAAGHAQCALPTPTSSDKHTSTGGGGGRVRLHPLSGFRLMWDALIVFATVYNCCVVPLRVTFWGNDAGFLFGIDLVMCVLYAADVVVNFNTGYDDEGHIVMQHHAVRMRYIKTYCLPDTLSAFPWDIVILLVQPHGSAAFLWRGPRLLRLLKVPQAFQYLSRWEDLLPINSFQLRMTKIIFVIFLFAHVNACVQLLVAQVMQLQGEGSNFLNRLGILYAGDDVKYLHGIFRAISNMVTIGYGIESPQNYTETVIILLSVMLGAALYLVLVGIINALMQRQDRTNTMYTEQMQMWKEYMRVHRVPQALRNRVIATLKLKYASRRLVDEAAMMRDVNPTLRTDIQMHVLGELVAKVPIFQACRPCVARAMVSRLSRLVYPPGDAVFQEGEIATEMFFVASGTVTIQYKGEHVATLTTGGYFGEFALLENEPAVRSATCVAVTYVELYALSKQHWEVIATHYPEVVELFSLLAEARQQVNQARNITMQRKPTVVVAHGGGSSEAGGTGSASRRGSRAMATPGTPATVDDVDNMLGPEQRVARGSRLSQQAMNVVTPRSSFGEQEPLGGDLLESVYGPPRMTRNNSL